MLPEIGVIFDAGTGIFRARDLLQTDVLHIFLSHVHLDHSVGLTFLFDVLHEKELSEVVVHAEPQKIEAIEKHLLSELLFPVSLPVRFEPLPIGEFVMPGGGRMTTFPLKHPGGSVGFRVDWEHCSFAYVTDTTADPNSDYVGLIQDVDLLVHECYFPDGAEDRAALTGHSCTTPVAQVASRANTKALYLVHINPLDESDDPIGLDIARSIFTETHIAFDGLTIEF